MIICHRDDFLMALKDHQVLVLVGETGSGKAFNVHSSCIEDQVQELNLISLR